MNISEATKRACEEPTLADALSWICVWESERAIKQALYNTKHGVINHDGSRWETCFKRCIVEVMGAYPRQTPMGNQCHFEVVRDFVDVLARMKEQEEVTVTIKRHGNLFDWGSTNGETYNCSELSRALQGAYENFKFNGR